MRHRRAWRRASSCRATSSSRLSTSARCSAHQSSWSTASSPMPAASQPNAAAPLGWYDVSTLKEPYRLEGKKTMAFELAEQLGWRWPDVVIYPTGGGTGLIGMWKGFEELEAIGWMAAGPAPAHDLGAGRRLRAHRQGVCRGPRCRRAGHRRAHHCRRLAGAAGRGRLPDAARDPRKRRHGTRGVGRGDGGRNATAGATRRHQRRPGRRRHAGGRSTRWSRAVRSAATNWWCCSTPEAR